MNRNTYKTLVALLWLAPLAMGCRCWQLWDRLPMRMASHFDAAGQANGWMGREAAVFFDVFFLVFLAAVFSVVLYVIQNKYPLAKLSWALLAFLHAEIWTIVYMLDSALGYNIDGRAIAVAPLLIVTPIGLVVILGFAFAEKRGSALPATEVVAEEVHACKPWGLLFLAPLVGVAMTFAATTNAPARLGAGVVGVLLLATFAMAWDGFHYFFTRHGVEIRTLGFRLKSIPLLQIKQYEIEDWMPSRGYGIRGIGNRKAFVWGKRGVRVEMYDGEIFLGHNDPQRIVHDLNVIKQKSHL
jgi:uncharacterized protein DUF1648